MSSPIDKIRYFLFRCKNFLRYGRIGWRMYCSCCYDPIFDLIITRLQQMEGAPQYVIGRDRDVRNMRTVRLVLERVKTEDSYGWDAGVGLWKPNERTKDKWPWDEGYISPIDHIPNSVLNRRFTQKQKDFQIAMRLIAKHMMKWWQ